MDEQPPASQNAVTTSWQKVTSALRRSKTTKSVIGIEDIDATWEFSQLRDYNAHMDEALTENEITQHWLCSDMRFDDDEMLSREYLEAHMKVRNYELLGIITTADYAWHIQEQTLRNFRERCVHPSVNIDLKQKSNLNQLPAILAEEEFAPIRQLLTGDLTGQLEPGEAYNKVKEAYCAFKVNPSEKNSAQYEKLKQRARGAKYVLDLICAGFDNEKALTDTSVKLVERSGIKGLILRRLLHLKSDNISYVFFDDKPSEVLDVVCESAKGDLKKNTLISAFVSPTKKDDDYSKTYYTQCIHKHFKFVGIEPPKSSKEPHRPRRRRALSITANPSESSSGRNSPKSGSRSKTSLSPISSSGSSDDLVGSAPTSDKQSSLKMRLSSAPNTHK